MSTRRRLVFAGAVSAALVSQGVAQDFGSTALSPVPEDSQLSGRWINNWSLTLAGNYSTNFARLPDRPLERRFVAPDDTFVGVPVFNDQGQVIGSELLFDTVEVGLEDRFFTTADFAGTSVFFRPRFRGILQGRVTVSQYINTEDLGTSVFGRIQEDLPQAAIDQDAVGFIGERNLPTTFVSPDVTAFTSYELLEDILFFETGGFVQEQAIGLGNQLGAQTPGQNIDETVLGGYFASPVFRQSLGNAQEVQLRLRYSGIQVISERLSDPTLASQGQLINDSISYEGRVEYQTGEVFGPVNFQLSGFARRFEEDGGSLTPDQDIDQLSGALAMAVSLTDSFAIEGTVGYDDVTSDFTAPELDTGEVFQEPDDSDLSGLYYYAGFIFEPNPRTRVAASVGERFNGTAVQADVRLSFSPRWTFNSNVRRVLTSGQQDQLESGQFFNLQSFNAITNLAQRNDQLSENNIRDLLNTNIGNVTRFSVGQFNVRPTTSINAQLSGNYSRNRFTLSARAQIVDDFDGEIVAEDGSVVEDPTLSPLFAGQGNQFGASATASRNFSRRLTGQIGADYVRSELAGGVGPDDETDVQEIRYLAGLNYQVSERMTLSTSATYLRRDAEGTQDFSSLFGGTILEFEEVLVRAGLTWAF